MGVCASKNDALPAANDTRAKEIENSLKMDRRVAQKEIKLLLLGAGESGKSTVFKQMKIIHNSGYSREDKTRAIPVIQRHVVECFHDLVRGGDKLGLIQGDTLEEANKMIQAIEDEGIRSETIAKMAELWSQDCFQEAYTLRNQFQLSDSSKHFLDKMEHMTCSEYVPSYEDILKCRVRTTGVTEMTFDVDGVTFRMVDVGGQRSERRKWIHCFDDVTAVLFVVALSEYNQVLYEDGENNRMKEALRLFGEICTTRFFSGTSIILFLNKSDLFKEKIATHDLSKVFPDYTGGTNYDAGVDFIREQFTSKAKSSQQIFSHVTCATDTGNIRFVFDAVKESILAHNVTASALF